MVLQIVNLADRVPAETGDDEVELAVAVEVRRLHVGDASLVLEERDWLELVAASAAQPEDAAAHGDPWVGHSEIGHENIGDSIFIQIDDFAMRMEPFFDPGAYRNARPVAADTVEAAAPRLRTSHRTAHPASWNRTSGQG